MEAGGGVILGVGARVRFEFLRYGRTVAPILAHNQLGGRILGVLLLFCSMRPENDPPFFVP